MRFKAKAIGLLLLGLMLTSCKPADNDESGLSIVVGPNPAFALPADLFSCKQEKGGATSSPAITQPSVEFPVFKLKWAGEDPVRISQIEVTFTHGSLQGGKFSCFINSTELLSMSTAYGSNIPGGDPITSYDATCGIRCGPIPFLSNVSTAFVPGVVKVYGVTYDAENVGTPVISETTIAIEKRF